MTTAGGGASRRLTHLRLAHVWQLPLMLLSLALYAGAAWLFLDARPAITLNQKLAPAREYLRNDRPDAALESLSRLAAAEKLPREGEAQVHLLMGEALEAQQKQRGDGRAERVEASLVRVIEETQIALAQGVKPTGEIHRRLGESYEGLGKPVEAVSQYRQAIAMDPPRAMRLQRKVIDLQLATSDWAPAEASLDAYLASPGISDSERAWALGEKAMLLVDRGEALEAKRLLADAQRLARDPVAQAEAKCRLGVCAFKLGSTDEAEKLLRAARSDFKGQHPLDAEAAYVLGVIRQEKNDFVAAVALFDAAIAALAEKPDAETLLLATLRRGECRVLKGDADEATIADLTRAAERASSPPALKDQALATVRKASSVLTGKGNLAAAIELLDAELALEPNPPAAYHGRLAAAYEKRADQVEQSVADAPANEQVRRQQLVRDFRTKAADAHLAHTRALASSGDGQHAAPLWRAVDLYDRAGNRESIAAALELFVGERDADPLAADALLRLGRTYEAMGNADKAIFAYERLQQGEGYRKSPAAAKAALPLASLYLGKGPQFTAAAEKLLAALADGADAPHPDRAVADPAVPDPAVADAAVADARKLALLELARLYQRASNWRDALPRLERFIDRHGTDERCGEAVYLAAECYAHLARQIDVRVASATASVENPNPADEMARAAATKKQLLARAAGLYDRAREVFGSRPPTRDADRRYQQLSLLRRADCAYDLGNYAEAIALYERAAREADVAQSLAAHVQIANALHEMNRPDDARAANERAKSLLHQLPQAALQDGTIPMPRAYLEQWLKWSGSAGTW